MSNSFALLMRQGIKQPCFRVLSGAYWHEGNHVRVLGRNDTKYASNLSGTPVEKDHYDMVGRALIATLQNFDATAEEVEAWNLTYSALSSHMIATAYPEAASA
jgi:hemoglobin-like flavoprotein